MSFEDHVDFWSNDYLGLANHPEVRKADAEAAAKFGLASPMGARMMSGNSVNHLRLEKELAEFVKKQDVMLLKAEAGSTADGLQGELEAALQAATKMRGSVEIVARGSLPNDGRVVEDLRKFD